MALDTVPPQRFKERVCVGFPSLYCNTAHRQAKSGQKPKGLHSINNYIAHTHNINSMNMTHKKGLRCIKKVRASSKMSDSLNRFEHGIKCLRNIEKICASKKHLRKPQKVRSSQKIAAQII